MVKVSFERLEQLYEEDVKSKVCGRQTCSVLILVACEVGKLIHI